MPFTYRDKPKLADRLRGKSGEEILNELKSDLDAGGRRMFFDSPSWRTAHGFSGLPRGFPFDDDRNRINIRTYLDEIASRYPEFADQLRERPWQEEFEDPYRNPPPNPAPSQSNEASCSTSQQPPEEKPPVPNLTNFGFRNTVPLGPEANPEQERYQRSMSAPPENKNGNKKRFVSKCEIPIMNNPTQEPVQMKPDTAGRAQEQAPPKPNSASNVRVIPIQVEGRDTPLVNTNIDTAGNFGGEAFMEPSFEGRLPRDFGSYQRHSPRFAHKDRAPSPSQFQYAPQYQQYVPPQHFTPPPQSHFMPNQHFGRPDQQQYAQQYPQHQQHPQKQQHPQQQQQQQQPQPPPPQQPQPQPKPSQRDETDSKPPPPPQPKVVATKDPIETVQAIQKDVEELMKQVDAFKGNSRNDKQYLMLDELLTRQLLLLDVIDTEGKENVRQARKEAVRSIQRCISTLENKVPLVENNESATESSGNQNEAKVDEAGGPQPMNVDSTKENTPVDNRECQKMEVDEQGSNEQQPAQEESKQENAAQK